MVGARAGPAFATEGGRGVYKNSAGKVYDRTAGLTIADAGRSAPELESDAALQPPPSAAGGGIAGGGSNGFGSGGRRTRVACSKAYAKASSRGSV